MSRKFLISLVSLVLLLVLALGISSAQDDRPIVVTWWSEPSNVDIHSFGTDGDSDARFMVYAPLIRRATTEGPYPNTTVTVPGEYEPAVAESWDVDDGAGTVTFHLREGATFASGNPVTAEDVRWTVERGFLSPTSYMSALMPLGDTWSPPAKAAVDQLEALGLRTLESLAKQYGFASFEQLSGEPADVIIDRAQALDAEMVIMGSRGRRGLARLVLGSVAEKVIRNSHCSVLVARTREAT